MRVSDRAAIILAGGEGTRLRRLTRALSGDDRPKQFCAMFGGETLLGRTRRRVAKLVPPSQTAVVLTRTHQRFWSPAIDAIPPSMLVVQPEGRGTAPAILYGLMRLRALGPTAPVAIFPSDHWFSDDDGFMAAVATAYDAVETLSSVVVLLGLPPDRPEPQYGWIEPGAPLPGPWVLREVNRFVEKPTRETAERLYAAGGLWNAFVLIGQRWALLDLFREATPALVASFAPLRAELDTPD